MAPSKFGLDLLRRPSTPVPADEEQENGKRGGACLLLAQEGVRSARSRGMKTVPAARSLRISVFFLKQTITMDSRTYCPTQFLIPVVLPSHSTPRKDHQSR